MIVEVHTLVEKMADKRTDQLLGWGIGVIGFLVATIGWLLSNYVFK
jgi:hypothetical protein